MDGTLPPGQGARDRVLLPDATAPVVDVGGNVAEWALDYYVTWRGELDDARVAARLP